MQAGRSFPREVHAAPVHLARYLALSGSALDPDEINAIGCQVLDLYFALLQGESRAVDDDLGSWLYAPGQWRVIFPWRAPLQVPSAVRAEAIYRSWIEHLESLGLELVKPTKHVYPAHEQRRLREEIRGRLMEEVASLPSIRRIHLMGASLRMDMGYYAVPFVHGRQVKAGSDINVLIEIDANGDTCLPDTWKLYVEQAESNSCPVYHLGEVALPQAGGDWQAIHPALDCTQHLIEAYVFLPASCDAGAKNAFLDEFRAELLYDRDAVTGEGSEEERVALQLAACYDLESPAVTRLDEPTSNLIYRVETAARRLVLKVTLDAGTYSRRRLAEHARYEAALIEQLRERGVSTPAVIRGREGHTARIDAREAILFEHFEGAICERLEYPVEDAARALAQIHEVQRARPLDLPRRFDFAGFCAIWMPHFEQSRQAPDLLPELASACKCLAPVARRFLRARALGQLIDSSVALHCHGDVKPRNLVVHPDCTVSFFDFDNALFAPRLSDVVHGGIAFALAEQHIDHVDFARCVAFLAAYRKCATLTAAESAALPDWLLFGALLQFIREITTWVTEREDIRKRRALAAAGFIATLTSPDRQLVV